MIKVVTYELTKIVKNRIVIAVISATLLLNAVILRYQCLKSSGTNVDDSYAVENYHIAVDEYPEVMDRIISQAESNLKEFDLLDFTDDDYNVRYQKLTAEAYREMKDSVGFSDEPVSGWDLYFDYSVGNIFALCIVLITSIFTFTQDHIAGIYPIIYSTKNGRRATECAK